MKFFPSIENNGTSGTMINQKLKTSHSSNELAILKNTEPQQKEKQQILETTKSESDLLKYTTNTNTNNNKTNNTNDQQKRVNDAKFLEELIKEFDKHTVTDDDDDEKNKTEQIQTITVQMPITADKDQEEIEQSVINMEDPDPMEDNFEDLDDETNDNNPKALQIIKENSEILQKLLNKKTTACHPELLVHSPPPPPNPHNGIQTSAAAVGE